MTLISLLLAVSGAGAQQVIPQWQIERTPRVSIGEDGGPAEFLRIVGVFRLSDGLLAAVNGTTSEVRIFDERGTHVATFGRQGAGPGEFQSISTAWRSGDTLMLGDLRLRRITTLLAGPKPRLLGTTRLTARNDKDPNYSARGRIADGRWLAVGSEAMSSAFAPGVRRLNGWVGVVAGDGGGTVEWLAELPSMTVVTHNPSGDFRKGGTMGAMTFSPWLHGISSGGSMWFGESSTDSLIVFDGSRSRVVRLPMTLRSPSRPLIEARRKTILQATPAQSRPSVEALMKAEYIPRSLAYYELLVPGPRGEVWVQEYAGMNLAATRYLVMGPDLKPRAWVPVPTGYRVMEAGQDYVVGVHFDEDGVETVREYGLKRR